MYSKDGWFLPFNSKQKGVPNKAPPYQNIKHDLPSSSATPKRTGTSFCGRRCAQRPPSRRRESFLHVSSFLVYSVSAPSSLPYREVPESIRCCHSNTSDAAPHWRLWRRASPCSRLALRPLRRAALRFPLGSPPLVKHLVTLGCAFLANPTATARITTR